MTGARASGGEQDTGTDAYLNSIRAEMKSHFDKAARDRDGWKRRNSYYHHLMLGLIRRHVAEDASAVELGCSTGDLAAGLGCRSVLGLDFSEQAVRTARTKYPGLRFEVDDIENLSCSEKFDYVVCTDTLGSLGDVWRAARNMRRLCHPGTRIILTHYNYLWEPILRLAEKTGLKARQPLQHWLTMHDIVNLMELNGFRVVQSGWHILIPVNIPGLSYIANRWLARLPIIRKLCLVNYIVARPDFRPEPQEAGKVSVIVPTRDERDHIVPLMERLPRMGAVTEVVFVDGASTDGTYEILEAETSKGKPGFEFKLIRQGGKFGKADAMRKGFAAATGDYFLILDSDLSVAPEDLPKFYLAMLEGRGEFINGSRLNYPMQDQAMRYLNNIANHFFGYAFSWLLDQPLRDTLCGTKTLSRENYLKIAANRTYFGDFDPFGDFDLLFGAARLGLEIKEMPVRYRNRAYGSTKISRFSHGWLLLKMCFVALRKLKFS